DWVQRNAMRTWDEGGSFSERVLADPDISAKLSRAEIEQVFSPAHYLRNVDKIFARVFENTSSRKQETELSEEEVREKFQKDLDEA
ncbi:MAG: hypothetical protein LC746_08245, partial [Acidobacteria bacterium]|nr:hypothetical protein [Acidobacteriota bacterium]